MIDDYQAEDCGICGKPIAYMQPATTTEKGGCHKRCVSSGSGNQTNRPDSGGHDE